MSETRPRVLLADDHPRVLDAMRRLLERDFEVVAAVMDGRELLRSAERLRPDIVLSDISLPFLDGIEATRRLQTTVPSVRVLILSDHAEPSWVRAAFEAGACGYLTKLSGPEEIGTAIREVLKGLFYISSVVTRGVVDAAMEGATGRARTAPPMTGAPLTPRELDIVRLVGQGLSNKAIARQLGVAVTTVRTHLNRAYDKLGPVSRVELALLAASAMDLPVEAV